MKLLVFALAIAILGNGITSTPVDMKSMIDLGTINVDGVGPIHIVTPWGGNVQVNSLFCRALLKIVMCGDLHRET